MSTPSNYFLSATNPVANVDQRDLEELAIKLFARADVQAACRRAEAMWRRVTDRLMPPDQMALCHRDERAAC